VVDPTGSIQVNGPMCGLIAIAETELFRNQGYVSPWHLFDNLQRMGWRPLHVGDMLQKEDLESIADIYGCHFEVKYVNVSDRAGTGGPVVHLFAKGAHFLNGDQIVH
jgi:hypothetical protein